jgi:hypothetical protein
MRRGAGLGRTGTIKSRATSRQGAGLGETGTARGRVMSGTIRRSAGRAMSRTVSGRGTPKMGAGHLGPDLAAIIEAGRAVTTYGTGVTEVTEVTMHGTGVTGATGVDERVELTAVSRLHSRINL